MAYFGQPYSSSYVSAPIPPPGPIPGEYDYDPDVQYAEPGSPMIFPVSPTGGMSPIHSRDPSRNRYNEPMIHVPGDRGMDRSYHSSHLAVGVGSKALSRSNSERSRTRPPVYVEVAKSSSSNSRGRHGRSTSVGAQYYYDNAEKMHAESTYSNSSYGSRGHSRSHSKGHQSRSSSRGSYDSLDDYYEEHAGVVAPYRKKEKEDDLSKQLQKVQLQLEQVHAESDKRRKEEDNAKMEKLRSQEIERKVAEQLQLQKRKEAEAAAEAKRKADAEKARIKAEAEKIIAERAAAEEKKKQAEEAERAKIQAVIDQERAKYEAMNRGRRTYTKFSKVHLCKEALDERKIAYTEESEHFLVHRVVDKTEQNYLWSRTKEIRNYYRQIQEAADKAPTVRGPNGGWVKYVQIAGQPYPMALPVTITQTPGGGQTQVVDRIKWTDIFRQF